MLPSGDADIELREERGWTTRSFGVDRGHKGVVELLLRYQNAHRYSVENEGRTALSFVTEEGAESAV